MDWLPGSIDLVKSFFLGEGKETMETSVVLGRGNFFFLVRERLGGELGEPGTMKGDNERGMLRTFFFVLVGCGL